MKYYLIPTIAVDKLHSLYIRAKNETEAVERIYNFFDGKAQLLNIKRIKKATYEYITRINRELKV